MLQQIQLQLRIIENIEQYVIDKVENYYPVRFSKFVVFPDIEDKAIQAVVATKEGFVYQVLLEEDGLPMLKPIEK